MILSRGIVEVRRDGDKMPALPRRTAQYCKDTSADSANADGSSKAFPECALRLHW